MWSPISNDWGHHVAGEEKPLSRTWKLHLRNSYFSSQPDGSPDYVTSVSVSEPAMNLPPVYVDGQTYLERAVVLGPVCLTIHVHGGRSMAGSLTETEVTNPGSHRAGKRSRVEFQGWSFEVRLRSFSSPATW